MCYQPQFIQFAAFASQTQFRQQVLPFCELELLTNRFSKCFSQRQFGGFITLLANTVCPVHSRVPLEDGGSPFIDFEQPRPHALHQSMHERAFLLSPIASVLPSNWNRCVRRQGIQVKQSMCRTFASRKKRQAIDRTVSQVSFLTRYDFEQLSAILPCNRQIATHIEYDLVVAPNR